MIINPKRILWPTDFSPLSLKAADYAKAFCETFDAELHVIHVREPLASPTVDVPLADGVINTQLRRLCDEVFHGDKRVRFEARSGTPWFEVCAYADRAEADLIIVASHGRSGLKHVLLGSVAERIVQHASCPVLVVKNVERDFTAS